MNKLQWNFVINLINSPLEQFEILNLSTKFIKIFQKFFKLKEFSIFLFNIIFSNFFLFTFFIFFFIFIIFYFLKLNNKLFPNYNLYFFIDFLYNFIQDLIIQNIGIEDEKYNQYLILIFFFLLFSNIFGMIPYTFTLTSHILITFSLSLSIFIGINIIGIQKLKINYFNLFFPSGVPLIMGPFLILIELISYFAKVFSLAIRLFANIMSGHTLLKILSMFTWIMILKKTFWIFNSLIPLIIIFIITGLEIMIAILQAYVFTMLVCIYINDVKHIH